MDDVAALVAEPDDAGAAALEADAAGALELEPLEPHPAITTAASAATNGPTYLVLRDTCMMLPPPC
ncbi:MAG: hypothetical protein ACRDMJ_04610 [Solirubrobacteraceae bacterium]